LTDGSTYKAKVVGLSFDWIEVDFSFNFDNHEAEKLAHEMYKFCPDVIEQGVGSMTELIKLIRGDRHVFLWWD
jgi:hypothetical protein